MNRIESVFERLLWSSRFVVVIAVLATLLSSLVLFAMTTWDVVSLARHALEYASLSLPDTERLILRNTTVTHVVEVVDGYLLATFLLIFAFGLYELFVSDIDAARGERAASRILVIETLDDLKSRLAKVILMILIVKLFERLLGTQDAPAPEPLITAGCLVAIGLALWLSHLGDKKHEA